MDLLEIMRSGQVVTALLLIAGSLVVIAAVIVNEHKNKNGNK